MVPEEHFEAKTAWTATLDRLRQLPNSILARFAGVGIVNTIVDFGLYVCLFAIGLAPVAANFLSTSAGMAVSFIGNRHLVFGPTSNRRREITLFVVVCGIGIWVIQPLVIISTTRLLLASGLDSLVLLATGPKIFAIGIAAIWNYFLYSRVVFRTGTLRRNGE